MPLASRARLGPYEIQAAIGLARINEAKYAALRRLYTGLKVMTLAGAVFLVIAAWLVLRG